MKAVGEGFYGDIGKMNKGTLPYDQARVTAALNKIVDAAKKMPTLFPDDTKTGGGTHALPAIWDNKPDFLSRWDQLGKDATTALTLVTDADSLKTQSAIVGKNCTNCHEKYRAKLD